MDMTDSEVASGELASGAAFQVPLERARFTFTSEGNRGLQSPRPGLRAVEARTTVMIANAFSQILGNSCVVRVVHVADKNVDVEKAIHGGWPAKP